jgi:hypothetical protein
LTPLDFFFRKFSKYILYREKVQNVNEFREKIVRSVKCVKNKMLANT